MAPKKTTGSGKPPITAAEKAAHYGITIAQYKKRSLYGTLRRVLANIYVSEKTSGKAGKPGGSAFSGAWKYSNKEFLAFLQDPAACISTLTKFTDKSGAHPHASLARELAALKLGHRTLAEANKELKDLKIVIK